MVRRRYSRARPMTPTTSRQQFGWRSIFYRLKAKFDVRPICEQEVKAAGWDRSDYAPMLGMPRDSTDYTDRDRKPFPSVSSA
jgi:hypothetical protein